MIKTVASVCGIAAALLFAAPAANASDLGVGKGSDDGGLYSSPTTTPFQGFAAGIQFGGQLSSIDVADTFDGVSADGLVGGVHAEYLFGMGQFRVGPYIEGGWSNVNTELTGLGDLLRQESYYGAGLKAGVVVYNSAFVYAKAGYERANWTSDAVPGDITVDSYVFGGGVETYIAKNITLGLEANYLIPSNVEASGYDVTSAVEDSEQLRVLARVTWRQ